MSKIIFLCMTWFFFTNILNAKDINQQEDFESLLNEVSDIATTKSINVDYLPSVVTVIEAQSFIDAGVQNVSEALSLMPGIQMQLNYIGQPITNVRGFKNPNSVISDKIKILVDGVAINNEATATSGFYLDFPMRLIDKIELLRGPGSTVYGAGAFYGAVNIITKLGNNKNENQIYTGVGRFNYITTGGNFHTSVGKWNIFTDGYYEKNNKSVKSYRVDSQEKMKNLSLGIKVANGGFEFLTRYKASHYGNFFLPKGNLQPNKDDGRKDAYFFSQISYKTSINDFKLETKLNFSNKTSKLTAYFNTDANAISQNFSVVNLDSKGGFYIVDEQVEQNVEAEAILTLPKILSNDISIVLGTRQTNMPKNYFYSSIENTISKNLTSILTNPNYDNFRFNQKNEPAYWQNPTSAKIFNNTNRTIKYFSAQDLITLTRDTDLIIGARVDDYSDIGIKYSSRLGIVHRASDKLILKLLYGSAFRAPSFTEAYSNGHIELRAGKKDMKAEETKTYESAIIYKPDFNNRLSLNIYYSTLSNVIDLEEFGTTIAGYQNMKDRTSKGLEFEYFFRTNKKHNLYLNLSYIDSDYTIPSDTSTAEIDQSMPDISKLMIKSMYIYSPTSKLSFGTVLKYYSATTKTQIPWIINNKDKLPVVDKQHILDETVTYRFSSDSNVILTVKNVFNKDIRTSSYYYYTRGGEQREGRSYYLTYTQKF